MSNALARVTYRLDVPEEVLEKLVGRPDDDSEEWYQESLARLEEELKDEPLPFLVYAAAEPDVDVD